VGHVERMMQILNAYTVF